MGNFCILVVFERYLSNAWTDPQQILFVYGQCLPTCPFPLCGPSAPGAGGGEVKNSKNGGWSHSCSGQLPFLFFSALPNVVQYVENRPAHILVQNRQDRPRGFYRVGQKVRKKISNFSPFRDFTSIYLRNY